MDCPAQRKQAIIHFASRRAMNIDGLGERLIGQLVAFGYIETVVDLYRLTVGDLVGMKQYAEKLSGVRKGAEKHGKPASRWAENVISSINNSRDTTLERVLFALGIGDVGESTARVLATHFGSFDRLMTADQRQFEQIQGIGVSIA